MPRLSVSLDPDQEDWILEKKQEMGVSKGKVIRECINEVRTGDSLFTTQVNHGESSDDERLRALESRLESLEETIGETIVPAEERTPTGESATPSDERSTSEPLDYSGTESEVMSEAIPEGPSDTDRGESADATDESLDLPGSVLGDVDLDEEPESNTSTQIDPEPAENNVGDAPDITESNVSDDATSTGPHSTDQQDALPDSTTESSASTPSSSPTDTSVSDVGSRRESPSPASSPTRGGSNPSTLPGEEDELEKVDVDKDPEAIRSFLESTLEKDDHATAVFTCWQRIRDRGTVHTRSMHGLHDDYPLGYEDDREWWEDAIEPELVILPGIRPPGPGGSLYRFKY